MSSVNTDLKQFLRSIRRNLRYAALSLILKCRSFAHSDSIVILALPRSGSSWLSQIIAKKTNGIINNESLDFRRGVFVSNFNLGYNPKLSEIIDYNSFELFLKKTLAFKKFNKWTTSQVRIKAALTSKIVCSKFIIGDSHCLISILPKLNLRYKPILLLRHPIPTVFSWLKVLHNFKEHEIYENISINDSGLNYKEFEDDIDLFKSCNCLFEVYLIKYFQDVVWMQYLSHDQFIFIKYEDLLSNTNEKLNVILEEMGITSSAELTSDEIIRPSWSDFRSRFKENGPVISESLLKKIPKNRRKKVYEIFEYFNFDYDHFNLKENTN